jgi:hypothetical protein
MSIRLRLALAFAAAAAVLFAVGGWLFAAALSDAQLHAIDTQLTAPLATAANYLPGTARASVAAVPGEYQVQVVNAGGQVAGRSSDASANPLLSPSQLGQARQSQIWVTTTTGKEEKENLRVTQCLGDKGETA